MINVTKTFLPPIEDYVAQSKRIWENKWLTNRGELVLELEELLKKHLAVPDILLLNNGTIPLQIALKILGKGGEIITTPFSYVATSSAIVWENCTPVFVDIHPEYLSIDETKIEKAITPRTTAILATHVFGNPCDVDAIEKIAEKFNIKVIYDAAHAFDVEYKGKSLFSYGDVSTCSFHATKVFHTGEGGAIFSKDKELMHKIFYSHNFGHNGPLDFHGLGINGKMSELQGAMGLSVLPYMKEILNGRKRVVKFYEQAINWNKIKKVRIRENTTWNYSYFPVIFNSEESLIKVQKKLNENGIYPRRYFYPSLNTINYLWSPGMDISEDISKRIMCLPLYADLEEENCEVITKIINQLC